MIDKNTYLNLKTEIKHLCRKNIIELCDNMELNQEERQLLINFYDNKSRIQTCMEMGMSQDTYTTHMKLLFTKIHNYKNTLD